MSFSRFYALLERDLKQEERELARAKLCEGGTCFWACDVRSWALWHALQASGTLPDGARWNRWRSGHRRERFRLANRSARPLCGAKTRSGAACRARVCFRSDGATLAKRCRNHGGLSTGPKAPRTKDTPELRAAYLREVVACGGLIEAAARVGISYRTINRWMNRDGNFWDAVDFASLFYISRQKGSKLSAGERFRLRLEAEKRGLIARPGEVGWTPDG